MQNEQTALADKADKYFQTVNALSDAEKIVDTHKKKRDEQRSEIIELMISAGLTQVKDEQGRTIFLKKPAVYARFDKEHKEEAIKYMKEKWNMSELFFETIAPSTLNSIIKERLEQGQEVPEGLFKYHLERKLGHRR